jgi:hypothetical protein
MQYLRADLGWLTAGSSVLVDLSAAANVRLLSVENELLHQFGYPYLSYGVLATSSPVELVVQ